MCPWMQHLFCYCHSHIVVIIENSAGYIGSDGVMSENLRYDTVGMRH